MQAAEFQLLPVGQFGLPAAQFLFGAGDGQFHAAFPNLVGDSAGIRDGPGQPVEFVHDPRVAGVHGGEGLVEAGGRGAVHAGEAMIGVDAILGDAKFQKRLALDS